MKPIENKSHLTIGKLLLLSCTFLFGIYTTNAQETGSEPDLAFNSKTYNTAIGLRAGGTSGLTFKQRIGGRSAIEAILGVWNHGLSATLLYENHTNAFGVSGLEWYFGGGGHAAFYTGHTIYFHRDHRHDYYTTGDIGLGIDGIVGLEYKIPPIPMAISLDVKPFLEITSSGHAWIALDPGLGVKVAF